MERSYKIVHYLNQFFGQIGGESEADTSPMVKEGTVGPGIPLQQSLGKDIEIVATVICGDNYFAENIDSAAEEVAELVSSYNPNLFVAGPAFNAGRYGIACVSSCSVLSKKLGIPVITAMYRENPALGIRSKEVYVIPTHDSASGMKKAIIDIAGFVLKVANRQKLGSPQEEGYLPRGFRVNQFVEQMGAERAVNMLLSKVKGETYQTEYQMPTFERVSPSPAIKDIRSSNIALVTTGGIVPINNPDRIEAASASKFAEYNIEGIEDLTSDDYQTCHGGFDPTYANDDPDRVLPLDALRIIEKEGSIGKMHNLYYVTVGNATSITSSQLFGKGIAEKLKAANIDGVILTST